MSVDFTKIGVWLINLESNEERLKKMAIQLDSMGVPWKRFAAINGKERYEELISHANPTAYARNMGSHILPGKLGVYASHKAVWEEFLNADFEYALIFEDDVVFHEDFLEALDAAYQVRRHWDILRFNCVRAKIPVSQGTIGKWSLNAYIGPFTGNAAYLIKRNVAEKLIANIGPQTRALDHELNRFFVHDYRLLGMEPWASHTDDENLSTITGLGFSEVKKFVWYRRIGYYQTKSVNYIRRFIWLLKNKMVIPSKKSLSVGGKTS